MKKETSWEGVEGWYSSCVGEKGHHYHQSLILPGALRLLEIASVKSLLDLGCGQGVLARALPKFVEYVGIDASAALITEAKKLTKRPQTQFVTASATEDLPIEKHNFDAAVFILSLQNMERQDHAILQAFKHLRKGGKLLLVLNHPCFRIPRQSSWDVDEKNKLQSRRINRYLSPLKIPIQMAPSKGERSEETWSFHHSLSDYSLFLSRAGFVISALEEWVSDKKSEGKFAKMEDRARSEIPLFLAICATKNKD